MTSGGEALYNYYQRGSVRQSMAMLSLLEATHAQWLIDTPDATFPILWDALAEALYA